MSADPPALGVDYPVAEIFGFPPDCNTPEAQRARDERLCPFKGGECTKIRTAAKTPICSFRYRAKGFASPVIWAICANRLAAELPRVPDYAFGDRAHEARVVRELKIKDPDMTFDGVAMLVEPDGDVQFAGIEAQSIDTRGGAIGPLWEAYRKGIPDQWRTLYPRGPAFGVNTANVWKRLLPQVMNKGRMYADWETKLYVIVQDTLLQFMRGRRMHLHELSRQERDKAEIVWLPWDYTGRTLPNGQLETEIGNPIYNTVAQVEEAFTTVAAAQRPVFVRQALDKLARDDRAVRIAKERADEERARQASLLDDEADIDSSM